MRIWKVLDILNGKLLRPKFLITLIPLILCPNQIRLPIVIIPRYRPILSFDSIAEHIRFESLQYSLPIGLSIVLSNFR